MKYTHSYLKKRLPECSTTPAISIEVAKAKATFPGHRSYELLPNRIVKIICKNRPPIFFFPYFDYNDPKSTRETIMRINALEEARQSVPEAVNITPTKDAVIKVTERNGDTWYYFPNTHYDNAANDANPPKPTPSEQEYTTSSYSSSESFGPVPTFSVDS